MPRLEDFRSRSESMRSFLDLVHRVVDTDSSLLITGETGVGKEWLAMAIHSEGGRREKPFISVNCGAIPEQLLESELFGHEAGAFTGAERKRRGRFEAAHGGTIFLDEIGEMPVHLQVNLLTVLQRHRVQPVGSEETIPIDVRVMAATNRDLAREMKAGRFREDLFYRLNVVSLEVPSLRDRREDIADLVGGFISHFRGALGRRQVEGISDEALSVVLDWHWPGNVRELVNAIEHALVVCRTDCIQVEDLPRTLREADPLRSDAPELRIEGESKKRGAAAFFDLFGLPLGKARKEASERFERMYLERLLREAGGRIGETAARAQITPRALHGRMKILGLRKEDYR
jgi:DNA-binding NtrC family response regulator